MKKESGRPSYSETGMRAAYESVSSIETVDASVCRFWYPNIEISEQTVVN
jgi:hypothetical protein